MKDTHPVPFRTLKTGAKFRFVLADDSLTPFLCRKVNQTFAETVAQQDHDSRMCTGNELCVVTD